jgi:hypothetical protein
MNDTPTPVSIPWYETAEDFDTILRMVPPGESAGSISYQEWVRKIENIEQERRDNGFVPVRIPINPAAIKEWCDTAGGQVSRATIAKYAMNQMTFALLRNK